MNVFMEVISVFYFSVYQIYGYNVWCVCILSMHIVLIQEGPTALMRASMKGHTTVIELLLQHGADVNAKDKVRNV